MTTLAPALQAFFTERLISQRAASPNTIAGYRQTFRLLLPFASARSGRAPSQLSIDDLDAPVISAFLAHLENDRGNSPATRNGRLAAIHSMFAYIALHCPEHAATAQRVLAIPAKRTRRAIVTYLTADEADAVLAACDQRTWTGRRDHAMLALALQAGLRISELASLARQDIVITAGAHVHTTGKGRKERRTPLVPAVKKVLKAWLAAHPGSPSDPLFPGTTGRRLSRDAIERRLALAVTAAAEKCPSLVGKRVTMHTLRHSAAMRLLEAGNDITVIALWLGHEQTSTTNIYLNSRELHQTGGKPQVAMSGRYSSGLSRVLGMAA